jgi:hypothetical protein
VTDSWPESLVTAPHHAINAPRSGDDGSEQRFTCLLVAGSWKLRRATAEPARRCTWWLNWLGKLCENPGHGIRPGRPVLAGYGQLPLSSGAMGRGRRVPGAPAR